MINDYERKYLAALMKIDELYHERDKLRAELAAMTDLAKSNCKMANLHQRDSQHRWVEIYELLQAMKTIRPQVTMPPDLEARLAARWHELYE